MSEYSPNYSTINSIFCIVYHVISVDSICFSLNCLHNIQQISTGCSNNIQTFELELFIRGNS